MKMHFFRGFFSMLVVINMLIVGDQFFQLCKLIICNGLATTLALIMSFIRNFTCGFAFNLKILTFPKSSFNQTHS